MERNLERSKASVSRIDWEAAKTRALTHFDRNQVFRLKRELQEENPQVSVTGRGASARHAWSS